MSSNPISTQNTKPNDDIARLRAEYAERERRLSGSDLYSFTNPAYLYAIQHRQRDVLRLLKKNGLDRLHEHEILEVGCGGGGVLRELVYLGADPRRLHGVDLLENRLHVAAKHLPSPRVICADGQPLPYPENSFHLVMQFTAFSSLLDEKVKLRVAQEMLRVLKKPDGIILWYDFWLNPTNKETRGIRPAEVRRLFPNCAFDFHRITLAPPIARRLVPRSWLLSEVLEKLRFLNTHFLIAIRPR